MSTTTAIRVPAGWYADPAEAAHGGVATQRRWWDGEQWTHHVAPIDTPSASAAAAGAGNATVSTSVAAPATPSPRDSARIAESMPLHPVDPAAGLRSASSAPTLSVSSAPTRSTASPLSPANAETSEYVPFAARDRVTVAEPTPSRNPLQLRVHTVSVWLIATMPLTQALLVFWVFSTLPAESSSWTRALAVVFPLILSAALATQDRRLMELSGHLRTAPWIAAFLTPPVFLAIRGVRVARTTGARSWPLVVWLSSQFTVLTVWFMLDPATVTAIVLGLVG